MTFTWYVHLPSLRLAPNASFPIADGQIGELDFEQWSSLDSTFQRSHRRYEKNRPVFYMGTIELPTEDRNKLFSWINAKRHQLHLSFLLSAQVPYIPSPSFSCTYIRILNDDINPPIHRQIGPVEREWIVFNQPFSYEFAEENIVEADKCYQWMNGLDENWFFRSLSGGLHTLELTTRPEFWLGNNQIQLINGFIHCITAMESLLLPPKEETPPGMKLTSTFARHAAVLNHADRAQLAELEAFYTEIYRLRSKLIHGQLNANELNTKQQQYLHKGRQLFCLALLHTMALEKAQWRKPLPDILSEAYDSKIRHQLLSITIKKQLY